MNEPFERLDSAHIAGDEVLSERVKQTARRSPKYLKLAVGMVRDPEVPVKAKAALVLGGSYVVSPIDLVPGFIPILGQIDDLVVMMASLGAATRLCPPDVVQRHLSAVGLTEEDMSRDAETAELAGRWALAKGYAAVKAVAGKTASLAIHTTQRGYVMISSRVRSQ